MTKRVLPYAGVNLGRKAEQRRFGVAFDPKSPFSRLSSSPKRLRLQFFLVTLWCDIQQTVLVRMIAMSRPLDDFVAFTGSTLLSWLCGGSRLAGRHLDREDSISSWDAERWRRKGQL